jgi:hypothetical protein
MIQRCRSWNTTLVRVFQEAVQVGRSSTCVGARLVAHCLTSMKAPATPPPLLPFCTPQADSGASMCLNEWGILDDDKLPRFLEVTPPS